jgi:hypothetical protein
MRVGVVDVVPGLRPRDRAGTELLLGMRRGVVAAIRLEPRSPEPPERHKRDVAGGGGRGDEA